MIRIVGAACVVAAAAVLVACHSTSPAKPATDDFVITYEKTGGFLPFQDSTVLRGNGIFVTVDRTHKTREGHASAADVDRLRTLVTSKDFLDAAPEYRNDRGADLVTHTIDATAGGTRKRVVVMDSTEHPKVLDQIVAEMERLAASATR